MDWKFACPRWEERLRAGKSIMPALPLNEAEAGRAVAIFDKLRLPDVPGQPRMKEAAGEWQRDIVRAIFGSLVEGVRMVPEVFVMVPKKNSKTTGGAAFAVTWLLMNVRPRAEGIYIGPTQEVADLAFQQTVGMIETDDYLAKRFHVQHHTKTITDRRTKARLKVKTFDMKVVTGSKPAFVLLDELHLMATINGAARVIGQIRGGMLPNPEAVLVIITTQSDEPPAGAFKAELQYARGVRDGRIRCGRVLPLLYEFPEAMQTDPGKPWQDPAIWPMVMPNLGRSIALDRLVADYAAAKEKGEDEVRRWASQHLNVEIGLALHSDRWPGADYWLEAGDQSITLDYIEASCDVVVVGGDVGGLSDLWGLAVLGRHKTTRHWLLWTKAWAQPKLLERHPEIVERLYDFEADGDLVICGHVQQDAEEAAAIVVRLRDADLLPKKGAIGLDPAGVPALLEQLALHGIVEPMTAAVSQGYRLSAPIFGLERKLADGTLKHSGSRMMAWCVGNASLQQTRSNVYIEKKAPAAKIDPLMASFNAAEMMSRNPGPTLDMAAIVF